MSKIVAALFALTLALPAVAAELRVPLPNRDDLVLDVPEGWRFQVRRPQPDLPPLVAFTGADASVFRVLLTPIWPVGTAKPPAKADVRVIVQKVADQIRPGAVESELPLAELSAPGKAGYYFSATDRAPEKNGFKHVTQGAVAMDELQVTFTVLANGDAAEPTAKALALLRSMRRAPPQKAP